MTTFTENDLKELKDFIGEQLKEVNGKIDKLSEQVNGKLDKLSEQVNSVKVDLVTIKGELTGINKRLDNLEFTNRTIFVAIVAALMAGLLKLFFPNFSSNL
jgi:murein lipoprotein